VFSLLKIIHILTILALTVGVSAMLSCVVPHVRGQCNIAYTLLAPVFII